MYLLDSNICIKIMSKDPKVIAEFETKRNDGVAVSVISCAELEYGISKSKSYEGNKKILITFLTLVDILPFDYDASRYYGDIRADLEKRGFVIGNIDMMIAAHARSQGLTMVTNNPVSLIGSMSYHLRIGLPDNIFFNVDFGKSIRSSLSPNL